MRSAALVALVFTLAASGAAGARMYQWVSPESETVQLSGSPPSWYRNAQPGPRIQVYDGGRLIDDTAVPVRPEQADQLREAAFRELEQRRRMEALRKLERAARREARRREQEERQAAEGGREAATESTQAATTPQELEPPAELDESVIDQLKAIIGEWDNRFGAAGGASSP